MEVHCSARGSMRSARQLSNTNTKQNAMPRTFSTNNNNSWELIMRVPVRYACDYDDVRRVRASACEHSCATWAAGARRERRESAREAGEERGTIGSLKNLLFFKERNTIFARRGYTVPGAPFRGRLGVTLNHARVNPLQSIRKLKLARQSAQRWGRRRCGSTGPARPSGR